MRGRSFNAGRQVRPKGNPFQEGFARPSEWTPVRLPHDAALGLPRDPEAGPATGYVPGGVFEYRKDFPVPEPWRDACVRVRFEGVYRGAMVYVNGQFAASRPYGYSEFTVALDPLLRPGEDNAIEVHALSHADSRWYSGVGIYRDVTLFVADPVHVSPDGLTVTTPELDGDGALVAVAVEVENDTRHNRTVTVATEVVDADGAVVARGSAPVTVRAGGSTTSRQRLYVDGAQRWAVERPYLYSCRATVADGDATLDEATTPFGIRSLQLDLRHGLRVNGESVKLRGACVHHDNGLLGAATFARAEERRVQVLKHAGFNALRSAHQPASRALLDACDRVGMLVMDEAFDMWTTTKSEDDYARAFADWWEADVEAMVRKDRNHPSVVLYSIGNEVPEVGTPLGAALSRDIAEKVRSLDPTRYTTNSINALLAVGPDLFAGLDQEPEPAADATAAAGAEDGSRGVNTLLSAWHRRLPRLLQRPVVAERTAEAFASVDVAGYNYLDARYALDAELFPDRVVVGSEAYPTEVGRTWPLVQTQGHVIGEFTWTGWDYLGEAGIGRVEYAGERPGEAGPQFLGAYPWILAGCGDIDVTGHRRPASYYREIVFGLRKEPYVAVEPPARHDDEIAHTSPWSWPDVVASWSWDGQDGKPIRVEAYAAADEVELLVNGEAVGRAPAGPAHGFTARFATTYQPGELVAVAYDQGREVGRAGLRTAAGPVLLRLDVDRRHVRSDDGDLAFAAVTLVDAHGAVHGGADLELWARVDGPGVLQAFGSADPRPVRPYTATTCTTYAGRALAIVRPTDPGTITVTVGADECKPVTTILEAAKQ